MRGLEPLLPGGVLGDARMMQRRAMPDTCRVERPVWDNDEYGSRTKTYQPVYAELPCRIGQISAGLEASLGEGLKDQAAAVITVPVATELHGQVTIHGDDRVIVHGETYEVLRPQRSSYQTAQQLVVSLSAGG